MVVGWWFRGAGGLVGLGWEGPAQCGSVTCHRLAQYPDFLAGAAMGPPGLGGGAMRASL